MTDRTQANGPLADVVRAAVRMGARGVIVRDRDLADAERAALAARLRPVLAAVDGHLIVAGRTGDAIHLAAHERFPDLAAPGGRPGLVGRSCHNASEVDGAVAEGCDYVTVSPVAASESKPGYGPALGPAGLGALCRPGLPVFALGGVVPDAVGSYLAAGAYGIAVMGPVMRDPAIVVSYLKELP